MSTPKPMRPLPLADDLTEGFWAGARAHDLCIQRCSVCARWNHAPALVCPACGSEELGFESVSGRGTLFSWTILHDAPAPGFQDMLPLIVGLVELEEQPMLLVTCNLIGVTPDALQLGLPVEVTFDDISTDCTLPQFRPVRA